MAITYTESWAQSFSEDLDTREVTTVLHVVSDDAVLTAFNYNTGTHATTLALFPVKGQSRAENPLYRLNRISAPQFEGPRYAKVSAVWRTGPFTGTETDDPLSAPIRYRFRPVTQSEPTDAAFSGNGERTVPIINSAGDPFGNTVPGFFNTYTIEATRNEAAFDAAFSISFINKINQAIFQIAGYSINPGEALCTGIFPPNEYTLDPEFTPYIPVTYQFEVRQRLTLTDGSRISAFVYRLQDKGRRAFIDGAKKVAIYDTNGDGTEPSLVSEDVLLNEGAPFGEPADAGKNYWSVDPEFDPPTVGWITNTQIASPPLLAIDPTANGTFLYYRRFPETDFSGLNL